MKYLAINKQFFMQYIFSATIVLLLLSACSSSPVTVMVDKKFNDSSKVSTIIFDAKDTFYLKDTAVAVLLKPGVHSFVLDKSTAKEITVGDKGGILNLDNQEYIAHEIEYGAEQKSSYSGFEGMSLKALVIMDSNIIIPKKGVTIKSDSSIRRIIPILQKAKNGNFLSFPMQNKNMVDYDTNVTIAGIKKFGKDRLYIERFWDYTLNQEIPKTLQVRVNKNAVFSSSTTTRTSVMHAEMFLFYAMMNSEEYTVKSLKQIRESKEEILREKEKLKKQMAF